MLNKNDRLNVIPSLSKAHGGKITMTGQTRLLLFGIGRILDILQSFALTSMSFKDLPFLYGSRGVLC